MRGLSLAAVFFFWGGGVSVGKLLKYKFGEMG